jgi:type II secretory pathway pseudopilin PulG
MRRGFGLISLLISLAILATLTGVMLQGYFRASMEPLTRDGSAESVRPDESARLAEAQALLTRAMMALTLCAQRKSMAGGGSCSFPDVAGEAGVGATGQSADGRWQITAAQVSVSGTPPAPIGKVSIAGVGGNAKGLSASLFATPEGTVTRCEATGDAPPSSPASGRGC